MFLLRSILVCVTLAFCSCATSPDVNQHKWDVEISPVDGKHATFALIVRREHSEHSGNSKGGNSVGVVASAGEGRKEEVMEYGIQFARYRSEVGMEVSWIGDYYVRVEYDANFYVTGKDESDYQGENDQVVRGSTTFSVREGRHYMPSKRSD